LDARYIKKKMSKTLILIPSRLSATRLPGKPLLEINGIPMILHVVNKALSTKIGRVIVATEDKEIFDVVKESGNEVLMTGSHHKN
jgi:3-deoxy-manno-octulosonate cytidylyltransferase (CMP-KDO synthetase)